MIVLGIDPGTKRIGYGLVEKNGSRLFCLEAGILKIVSDRPELVLQEAKQGLVKIIEKFKPGLLVVERLYFAKNSKTALAVAEARGVILLAAAESGIPVKEYSPNEVKLGITGYGKADKKAVWKMVKITLKLSGTIIDDASDALALAILGCGEGRFG